MSTVNAAQSEVKGVGDPNAEYDSIVVQWAKSRATLSGEAAVKSYDKVIDNKNFRNLLLPFSGNMTQEQYNFYKAEAEWPGISTQFAKTLIGGLLRKPPILRINNESVPADAKDWILKNFSRNGASISAFLEPTLWEELQTSRAWVFVNYPKVDISPDATQEEVDAILPYPTLKPAEAIINWSTTTNSEGRETLQRVVVKGRVKNYDDNEFHPCFVDTVWVHELDESGYYQVRVYSKEIESSTVLADNGEIKADTRPYTGFYKLVETLTDIKNHDERLRTIPAWPLNGEICIRDPMLSAITDKEVHLYNLLSRRNHLLYGAATYTPVIAASISREQFQEIVDSGLGSWIQLPEGGVADVLKTPTEALADMDRAIAAAVEHIAKLGVRLLTADSNQSGVALAMLNAAPDSLLGVFSVTVSTTMRMVIKLMIEWRYGITLQDSDIEFTLSEDFDPVPLGADWLRLATEWYEKGLIPRTVWLYLLKRNDMISSDYDDESGLKEISTDNLVNMPTGVTTR